MILLVDIDGIYTFEPKEIRSCNMNIEDASKYTNWRMSALAHPPVLSTIARPSIRELLF